MTLYRIHLVGENLGFCKPALVALFWVRNMGQDLWAVAMVIHPGRCTEKMPQKLQARIHAGISGVTVCCMSLSLTQREPSERPGAWV